MKRVLSMMAVLALVCFATTVFAADAASPSPLGAAAEAAKAKMADQATKAASGEIIIGTIKSIDPKANTMVVRDTTITVKAEDLAEYKVGDKVKVTLASGTTEAKSIVLLGGKKAVKKEAKKRAVKATNKAIEKAGEQAAEKAAQ